MYTYKAKVKRVVDGDTLLVDIDLGMKIWVRDEKIRLYGINTPEIYGVKKDSEEYEKGKQASDFVKELLPPGSEVTLRTYKDRKEKYGRYLAELTFIDPDGVVVSLNELLVNEGLAERTEY